MTKLKIFLGAFLFTLLLIVVNPNKVYSQDNAIEKRENELAKKKQQQEKKAKKAADKKLKRHMKIQSKETRKRMKATQKKSRELHDGKKKEFYFKRFFKKRIR